MEKKKLRESIYFFVKQKLSASAIAAVPTIT